MGSLYAFIVRVGLSILLAVMICRFFFKGTSVIKIFGLALIMLGLAYLFQYTRRKDRGEGHGI
jgi:uncharacterized membrane protein